MIADGLFYYALEYCKTHGVTVQELDWWRNLPKPAEITDQVFLAEVAWCVYNAGMKEAVIRSKWHDIKSAFSHFYPSLIMKWPEKCEKRALKTFNHTGKVSAVIEAAHIITRDGPMGTKLSGMSESEALAYFKTFPFIGDVTKYHLARNVGFDVVKPDRHMVRLAEFFGFKEPAGMVEQIAAATGERKMFIDFILWRWLSWQGSEAYDFAKCYK